MPKIKNHRLHVLISDAEKAEVALAAHQFGVSVGAFTRACLEQGLRNPLALQFKKVETARLRRVRAPYMDPFDPASKMAALQHVIPEWAQALLDAGWTREELHYRNHAAAMRARGLEPRYDAVARHAELVAQVLGN